LNFSHFVSVLNLVWSLQVAKGRFRLPTATRYALCITVPLSYETASAGVPRLHSLKQKSANEYTPKKSWPLKTLQSIEGPSRSSDDDDFALTFSGKQLVWCAFQRDQLNEFLFLVIELCRQHFRAPPPLQRLNTDELHAVGDLWTTRHRVLERAPGSKGNPHIRALSAVFRQRDAVADEKEVIQDRFEVTIVASELCSIQCKFHCLNVFKQMPLMTAEEARDVQEYLDHFQLGISEIGELERRLKARLAELESQNIVALFQSEQARSRVVEQIDDSSDRLDEAVVWLKHHDYELTQMKAGITRIEGRNQMLEVLERNQVCPLLIHFCCRVPNMYLIMFLNQEKLQKTLLSLLEALELDDDVVAMLQNPHFSADETDEDTFLELLGAAMQLEHKLHASLPKRAFERMAAVQQRRAEFVRLRDVFCSAAAKHFELLFAEAARKFEKQIAANQKNHVASWESPAGLCFTVPHLWYCSL
jgi:hypothetical protein